MTVVPGQMLWTYSFTEDVTCTPLVATNGVIYSGDDNSVLAALSPSGTLLWKANPGGDNSGLGVSPALSGDGAILFVGSFDQSVYAVNTTTGATTWSAATSG